MALTLNDYVLRTDGSAERTSSGDLSVGSSRFGLICAAAFAVDDRLTGVNIQEFVNRVAVYLSPPIPMIDARGTAINTMLYYADTAVPYNIEKILGIRQTQSVVLAAIRRVYPGKTFVISAVFPAILARVVLFNVYGPPGTLNSIIRAKSTRDDGQDAIKKFLVRSYDANYTTGAYEKVLSLSYKIAQRQPFIDVWNDKTHVVMEDVTPNDIIIIAASDTSPNAQTISVTVDSGVQIQNLLSDADARYSAELTNPDTGEAFKVGCIVRVDRVKTAGTYEAILNDVTGAVQVVRLTPAFEIVTAPETNYQPPEVLPDNLAYFKVMVERTHKMTNVYPRWLLSLLDSLSPSGSFGKMANWPMNVLESDPETGEPLRWNELQLWAIDRAKVTGTYIPFGEAYIYPTRAEVAADWLLLDKQL
jgi:hypothetical protein